MLRKYLRVLISVLLPFVLPAKALALPPPSHPSSIHSFFFHQLIVEDMFLGLLVVLIVMTLLALGILSDDWKKALPLSLITGATIIFLVIPVTWVSMDLRHWGRPDGPSLTNLLSGPLMVRIVGDNLQVPTPHFPGDFLVVFLCCAFVWSPYFIVSVMATGLLALWFVGEKKFWDAWRWASIANLILFLYIVLFCDSYGIQICFTA